MYAKISLTDKVTGRPIQGFVNVRATDIKPFLEAEEKKLSPSLPTMILLENEIYKNNKECEFYDSKDYIDHLFASETNKKRIIPSLEII